MNRTRFAIIAMVGLLLLAGCSKKLIVQQDGIPISDYEYTLANPQSGIRISYVLARYYKQHEGKEFLVVPEYLDVKEKNKIDAKDTERLILHVKVVNLDKSYYSLHWGVRGKDVDSAGMLYSGHLSRKDYYVNLPLDTNGQYQYHLKFFNSEAESIFELDEFQYQVEGGVARKK